MPEVSPPHTTHHTHTHHTPHTIHHTHTHHTPHTHTPHTPHTHTHHTPHTTHHTPHTHTVSPNYVLSDFLVDSASLRRQLENERYRYEYEDQAHTQTIPPPPRKHQLISCLATRGQWVTREPALQLDPPDSQLLLMKGASLHFLFEPGWTLSGANQGDYLDMLTSIASRLENGTLK